MRPRTFVGIIVALFLAVPAFAAGEARVLRFPTVSAEAIVFSYAGDLFTVPRDGGTARRLTSHEGYEAFPRFSPDGKWVAFTAEYDGNREVYVMPAGGGVPKRLTYTPSLDRDDISDRMGPNNLVMGWTPDGRKVLFRSRMREWNDFNGQLYLVGTDGSSPEQLPLPRGGFASFSPDGRKLAYNRIFREFRTWKRFRGGMADDVWIYDLETKSVVNMTDDPGLDLFPMWSGDRVYFASDRSENKKVNLYVRDLGAGRTRKLTDFAEFDIKFPSLGPDAVVFENGGFLYRFDLASEKAVKVPVVIAEDMAASRTRVAGVSNRVHQFEIAPDGKRALFSARGDIFTVPAKDGNTRNLTRTPGVHERAVKWSPDGRLIAYISDASGTDEIWVRPQDGTGAPRQLTKNGDTYKYRLAWSPDSKRILWDDKMQRLSYVDVASGEVVEVVRAVRWEIGAAAWSPDSRWIAYDMPEVEEMNRVYLYSLDQKRTFPVTDGWYNSGGPAFSSDGKYLFFVSDRDFDPVYSATEWNHAYLAMSRVFFVTLAKDARSPFEPKSDETEIKPEAPKAAPKDGKPKDNAAEAAGPVVVRVDPEGLKDRLIALPVETSNYGNITVAGDLVYYQKLPPQGTEVSLMVFDLAEKKEKDLGPVRGYEVSADLKKMIVRRGGDYAIVDLPKDAVKLDQKLDLSGMEVTLDLRAEWNQIYEECWRQMKDFFYDPGMHGVDWPALRERYRPLAAAAGHRADLTYVIGELIGELSAGHTYVGGGEMPAPPKVKVGMLGAKYERDAKTGYLRVAKILRGQNWDRTLKNPLLEVGVKVKEGDYILAVNGRETSKLGDIGEALYNTVGRQVTLKVSSAPEEKGSREVVVVPVATENGLYYHTWVQENLAKVAKATGGQVGYIHVPDMGTEGLNEFVKAFYPQLRKKALIIDVRGNGGGNVSPQLAERLMREMVMVEVGRNGAPGPDPAAAVLGPKVCLCDEFSASDGDIFPFRFKTLKLGKLIGKRTWGGVVGIRGSLPLLDGGVLNKPEFAPYAVDGKDWVIEGRGVEPDIVVDNDPAREFAGIDDQLNKAIEVILEELKTKAREVPPVPPFPKK